MSESSRGAFRTGRVRSVHTDADEITLDARFIQRGRSGTVVLKGGRDVISGSFVILLKI